MATPIFRKTALDRLASPEQLDYALRITDSQGWLMLLGLAVLLSGAVAWSIYGRLPTRVAGHGILVNQSGLHSINAPTGGQVAELFVRTGQTLAPGQPVARLLQPDLDAELRNAQANLTALEAEDQRLTLFGIEEQRLRLAALAQQRATAMSTIALARERQTLDAQRLQVQEKLLKEGLVTETIVQSTRDNFNVATGELKRAQSALAELDLTQTQVQQRLKQEAAERQRRIAEAGRHADMLQTKMRTTSQVGSPAAGLVLEVRTAPGNFIAAGTPIVMLQLQDERAGLEALLYVPGTDAKRLRPGMRVEISPSTVKREEYGAIRGEVTAVSAFPATQQAMQADLGNPELVSAFFRTIESPIQMRAKLALDPKTQSGYGWTSPQGPPLTIQPGTLCAATITVRERAPIHLVIPLLREKLGL